jgi:beta-galactosidase
LPGGLTDVFGLRTNEFYDAQALTAKFGADEVACDPGYYEVLEPGTASVLASFTNLQDAPPAVTFNHYGKGRAMYVATPAQPSLMRRLYREILPGLGIQAGPATPPGVYARAVGGRVLYVNTTDSEKLVKLARPGTDSLRLPAFGVELIDDR